MKIAQFSHKNLSATWFVWNAATFKSLYDYAELPPNSGTNTRSYYGAVGQLKNTGVTLVVECRVSHTKTDPNTGDSVKSVGSGFTACSVEDPFRVHVGMKGAIKRAFISLRDTGVTLGKDEAADFYKNLFREGTFGWTLTGLSSESNVNSFMIDKFLDVVDTACEGLPRYADVWTRMYESSKVQATHRSNEPTNTPSINTIDKYKITDMINTCSTNNITLTVSDNEEDEDYGSVCQLECCKK